MPVTPVHGLHLEQNFVASATVIFHIDSKSIANRHSVMEYAVLILP